MEKARETGMVEWFWIPITFFAGGVFGVMMAALISAGKDDDDWER